MFSNGVGLLGFLSRGPFILRQSSVMYYTKEDVQRLADKIHKRCCHVNHINGCGYYNSDWEYPNIQRKLYYSKVILMLMYTDVKTLERVIDLL